MQFWSDNQNTEICREQYPELRSFYINENQTVKNFMQYQDLTENFHLPLSAQAFQQLQSLQEKTIQIQQSDETDIWSYSWNSSLFSSSKAYKVLTQGTLAPDLFHQIWKSAAILRYKIFFFVDDSGQNKFQKFVKTEELLSAKLQLCSM